MELSNGGRRMPASVTKAVTQRSRGHIEGGIEDADRGRDRVPGHREHLRRRPLFDRDPPAVRGVGIKEERGPAT